LRRHDRDASADAKTDEPSQKAPPDTGEPRR